jgi:hypothetical protein
MDSNSTFDLLPPLSLALIGALAFGLLILLSLLRWWFGPPAPPARRWELAALRVTTLLVLLAILFNPIRVDESPGPIERARVVYLLDASRSMSLGGSATRWEDGLALGRESLRLIPPNRRPEPSAYRFGEGLSAIDLSEVFQTDDAPAAALAATSPRPRSTKNSSNATSRSCRNKDQTPTDARPRSSPR